MSLRDQLMKAGLANKKKVAKTNRELKKTRRQGQAKRDSKADDRRREHALQQQAETERRAKANQERAHLLAVREAQAKQRTLRKLVRSYALSHREGPLSFWHRAPDGKTLLRLRIPESWALDLQQGRMAVAWSGPTIALYDICILPDHAAKRVRAQDPRRILFFNEQPPPADDPAERLYGSCGEVSQPTIPESTEPRSARRMPARLLTL